MKTLIRLFFINIGKAILFIVILAVYIIPLHYIVTSYIDYLIKGLLMFIWVVLWIVMAITVYQYLNKKQHGKEDY